jgi:hypothetical protein
LETGVSIILQTGLESDHLEFRDSSLMADGQNFSTFLVVRSGGFRLERAFWFEPFCLERFISDLSSMDESLAGRAVLRPDSEPDHVTLEMLPGGSVRVTGEISDRDDPVNALTFGFLTDQSCLKPFIADLRKLAKSHVAA